MNAKLFNRLLVVIVTATIMMMTLMDLNLGFVSVLAGLAMIFILPGYAVTTAIFLHYPLGTIEKLVFTLGFSLGITALGGMLLNLTEWGLQAHSWVLLHSAVVLSASIVTIIRLYIEEYIDTRVAQSVFSIQQLLLILMAGVVMVAAYYVARTGAENRPRETYTQLWMLWTDESETVFEIGIQNQETRPIEYALSLRTTNSRIETWDLIQLNPGERWRLAYEIPDRYQAASEYTLSLYRLDNPTALYRTVHLRRPEPLTDNDNTTLLTQTEP